MPFSSAVFCLFTTVKAVFAAFAARAGRFAELVFPGGDSGDDGFPELAALREQHGIAAIQIQIELPARAHDRQGLRVEIAGYWIE